ncbi:nSTAND1 domain-containing NTPase [Sorangium sp. So ce131]|uniref:nSTAND1 domain-containing NTPase n=1 Tax=Sorangium sp. So ce131 TaxID=3133282 RepID=UPI003F6486AC
MRLLGRGGMGQVYLAEDTLLDRRVAVKFIASRRPDEAARRRFYVEARAVARLQHPNVVAVHRVGEVDGRPYLVTEFVQGQTLEQLEKPVPWQRAAEIGLGLAQGLAAAHRSGVLHRDIKPANAMLTEAGEVKLLDFGLAKLLASPGEPGEIATRAGAAPRDAAHGVIPPADEPSGSRARASGDWTSNDEIAGTPRYMAPEVLRGEPATRRSDLYALGALLYELCAGVPPRDTVPEELPFEDWIVAAPTPLRELAGGISARFAAAVSRCLHVDPELRFPSAESLGDELQQIGAERSPGDLPEGNPYRGLRPFEAEHRALFFGRSAEVEAVLDRLRSDPLVVVAGDSGVGKSSLCRAGVAPRVEGGDLGDGRRYTTLQVIPGRRPLAGLAAVAAPALQRSEESLYRQMLDEPGALGRELRRALGRSAGALILVDQLEELHTLSDHEEAARFAEEIARAGAVAGGVRVLATVRGDFFTRLAALPGLGEELARALYLLRTLSAESMRQAIAGPAGRKGFTFESDEMVEALVASAMRAPGGLPLLQFAMAELWEARDLAQQRIPASALSAIGGVAGALARHADGVLKGLQPEQREAARRVLLRLVTAEGTRTRRTAGELDGERGATRAAIEALVRGRLLVAREVDGETTYEVAHEALLQGWDTLRRWLDAGGEKRRLRERVEVAAAEWERLGRTDEVLWSARMLAEAAAVDPGDLQAREVEFVEASRRRARRLRRRRWAAVAAAPLLVAAAWAGLRLKAQHDLDRVIAGHEAQGRAALEEGRRSKAEADALRRKAFELFDAGSAATAAETAARREEAEFDWARALDASRRADGALARAAQSLEAGLMLDLARREIRALLGDAHVERIVLAEWFHHEERRADLTGRLAYYDEDGSRRRWLSAPPRVRLASSPAGARITLARYHDEDGRLKLGPSQALIPSPDGEVEIDQGPGSYVMTLEAAGHEALRLPLLLERGERLSLEVALRPAGAVPDGYIYIPPGRFLYGSRDVEGFRRGLLATVPLHEVHTGGYLIGRTEVTFAAWIEFLADLPPAERARRTPGARSRTWAIELAQLPGGAWQLDLTIQAERATAREGEPIRFNGRDRRAIQDWRRFPVSGISSEDAQAYVDWLHHTGRLRGARLCDEREWERAARGADDRAYPHGDRLEAEDANFDQTYGRRKQAFGPDEVGSHPASASPFGALDMTGNVYELTRSAAWQGDVPIRGGSWYYDAISDMVANRTVVEAETRDISIGLRVCADAEPGRP